MARILVVEDEAPLRRIILLNLVRRGHSVIEAESVAAAQEAMAAFAQQIDLMLLDLNLPDRTGWDLLRSLEQTGHGNQQGQGEASGQPKVIIITAIRPVRSRLEEFHPAAVLLKPFPIEALLRLIQRVLGTSSTELADDAEEQHTPSDTASPQASLPESTALPPEAEALEG